MILNISFENNIKQLYNNNGIVIVDRDTSRALDKLPLDETYQSFYADAGLPRMDMTSTPSTSSSGSPCSRTSMRSSTTTTSTARRGSSAKS